jgi:hypothetical protein
MDEAGGERVIETNLVEDWDRIYVTNLWSDDWDSPEDAVYDEPIDPA